MKLLTLAWGEDYTKAALSLLKSARRYGLELTTIEISGEPASAKQAKRLKPVILRAFLKMGPVTWLDADSHIHKIPKILFSDIDEDMAMFSPREGEFYNGTLVLSPTPKTFKILDLWESELAGDDWELDQQILSAIIKREGASIMSLPFSYHWMAGMASPAMGLPVIEQFGIGSHRGKDTEIEVTK